MKLSIIGTGYVGLVSGVCFANLGHQVICVDIDQKKVQLINAGRPPIYEEGLQELLTKNIEHIQATTDYKEAVDTSDITFICVGTPSKDDGSMDLTFLKKAAQHIGTHLKNKKTYHIVVVKSTVPPGTTQDVVIPLLEKHSRKLAGKEFGVGMNPEFLREGAAVQDFLHPDRIVIGWFDEQTKKVLTALYEGFSCPIVKTSLSAAEMIKYASNAFLATKISFINEIGNACKKLGVDTYEVAEGMGLDTRIGGAFLNAGIGWGGSCFPKDVNGLITWGKQQMGEEFLVAQSARDVNEKQPLKLVQILEKHLPKLHGKTIGILGVAFKPNTDDIRESRAIPIVKNLLDKGTQIKIYDPMAMENFKACFPHLTYCSCAEEVLDADAILILTIWDEFRQLDYRGKIVIDGRKLDEARAAKIYEGVCW